LSTQTNGASKVNDRLARKPANLDSGPIDFPTISGETQPLSLHVE